MHVDMYKPVVELGFFYALAPPGKYNGILKILNMKNSSVILKIH